MREFLTIVAAAFVSSVLGALFGWAIGRFAPEVLSVLFPVVPIQSPPPTAAALGAICGLLLGAGAMAAGLFIAALRQRAGKPA